MNELTIFTNSEFGEIRTLSIDGEPWFVAVDVCRAIGLGNPSEAVRRLDEDEKALSTIEGLSKGNERGNVINEPGLYSLILVSRKPEAKAFKRWITHDVIPAIRKHGGYIAGEESASDEELLARALMVAQRKIEERTAQLAAANRTIDRMQPKALFADSVAASSTSILVGELAKILKQNGVEVGQNRLFEILRREGYLMSQKGAGWNMPSQRAMEMKLFEIKERTINNADGSTRITRTPCVTGKGQVYFINKFLGK